LPRSRWIGRKDGLSEQVAEEQLVAGTQCEVDAADRLIIIEGRRQTTRDAGRTENSCRAVDTTLEKRLQRPKDSL